MVKLGVVGGLGPFATVDFLRLFYSEYSRIFKVLEDQQFPDILVDFVCSTPDRTKSIINKDVAPVDSIRAAVLRLVENGCNLIFCPCNTVYYFLQPLFDKMMLAGVDLINPIVETGKHLSSLLLSGDSIFVLGTRGTIVADLYGKEIASRGMVVRYPDEETLKTVMDIIYHKDFGVKPKGPNQKNSRLLQEIVDNALFENARVLLACSELPIVEINGRERTTNPMLVAVHAILNKMKT